ncbi:MAG UNVERIFIED_CONTAM: recombinase family protein [Microcystis novacekii LVE1205-3]|jgi:hypothetical protein
MYPEECRVIELIRRHHKSGKSLQKIADWLNEQGYTTKRGQPWQRTFRKASAGSTIWKGVQNFWSNPSDRA